MATDSKTTHSQTSPAWTIRAYRPGDERALVALFARVFGRSIPEAHWLWKLKARPSPVENVWLAVHGDRPIFQYAGIPVRYRLPDGERHAMVSVDTMTDPQFQRRGLLTQVGQYAYDAWRAAGVSFVIGLPNQRWGSRTGALGWVELFPLSPHVVYAPSRVDFHPEHWKVAYALSLLLLDARMQPTVRVYQVHVPLTAILTNRMSDVSGLTAEMTAAIDAYVTQSNSLVRTIRQRRYAARYYGIKQQAEEFWQMSSRQYRLLHSEPVDRWPVPAFRGLRHRSTSDPWAYLQGTPERRRLARLVMSHEP